MAVFGINRHADRNADRSEQLSGIFHAHLLHLLTQDFGAFQSAVRIGIGKHEGKFLASVAAGDVLSARASFQEIAEDAKERVAGLMAERIVEPLEVIKIDHYDREIAAAALALC